MQSPAAKTWVLVGVREGKGQKKQIEAGSGQAWNVMPEFKMTVSRGKQAKV